MPASTATYDPHCTRCPRLAAFLERTRARHPDYWARPVPSFGAARPRILIVGLAPGMHGANRTGRPFTGDHAGILLYLTLHKFGLASSPQSIAADDGLKLQDARITNSVKCLPPANKPLPVEVKECNAYLRAELQQSRSARVILALGAIAHVAEHELDAGRVLLDSYHCSRYNTQTRRLTTDMFEAVIQRARDLALA